MVMGRRPEVKTASAPVAAFAVAGLAAQLATALASVPFRRPWAGPAGRLHNVGTAVTRTVLRAFNRMNELIPTVRTEGRVLFGDNNIYEAQVDPVEVRRRIGMVFQKANPFPKSIYENVAWGARINGYKGHMDELVEQSLRDAAIWDEVQDKLDQSGLSLSGGQQQRLCIARAIAVRPEIILMDEPASALDPIATLRIEELMHDLAKDYTIIIVTHNMQQAARVSDYTGFFSLSEDGERAGMLMEYGETKTMFTNPKRKITEDYITGRFG